MAHGRPLAAALTTLACVATALAAGGSSEASAPGAPAAATVVAASCARIPGDVNGDGYGDVAVGVPGWQRGSVELLLGGADPQWSPFIGLSPSRSGTPAGPDTLYGTSVVSDYFDSDCYADLAVGWGNTVELVWGHPNGLSAAGSEVIAATSAGTTVATPVLATGDFNGDGHPDLAIGDINYDHGAGRVEILYGTADGLTTTGEQVISQDSAGVPGTSEPGDHFGAALATGDFNGDGRRDLAIGSPGEDIGAAVDTGDVTILDGSTSGLTGTGATSWHEATPGVPGAEASHDAFGTSLATGDGALAIGAPGATVAGKHGAGTVTVLSGLSATGATLWSQNSSGVPGTAETGDAFGTYVTYGDFNGDGHSDLVASAPKEDLGAAADAGSVSVIYGSLNGLTGTGAQTWSQDSTGVAGTAERGDNFGIPFAIGLHGGFYDDLMIGVPNEDQAISAGDPQEIDAGAMNELVGGPSGLSAGGAPLWSGVLVDAFGAHAHFAADLA